MSKIDIPGLPPIKVVSDEEATKADFVLCVTADTPTPFDDNVETTCCDCGTAVIHRPYMPENVAKICVGCVVLRSQAGNA